MEILWGYRNDYDAIEADFATMITRLSASRADDLDTLVDINANIVELLARLTEDRAANLENIPGTGVSGVQWSGVFVDEGVYTEDVTITSVDTTKSFIVYSNDMTKPYDFFMAGIEIETGMFRVEFINGTTVRVTRGRVQGPLPEDLPVCWVTFFVVEFQ